MFLTKLNEVLASKKTFISDRANLLSLSVGLLINIIHWVILYIKIRPGSHSILLHYNVIYGPDLVDKSIYAYFIPGIALGILLFNILVSINFYKREKLASYFLNAAGIPVQLIFFAATLVLINANE